MKLVTDKGELTLPSDFSVEIEQNSAFFSEDGSASIGATIPATPADQAKLGFPTRIARANRFVNSFPASIQKGVFQKRGVLSVATATEDSITVSMALEDSEFYAQHKDKKLRDFITRVMTFSDALEASNWVLDVYKGNKTYDDFRIVPVAVAYDDSIGYQVNNEPESSGSGIRDLKHGSRIVIEGGSKVSVPEGYGLAPFLTLSAFFRELFEHLGYTVGRNCFSEHEALRSLILLHNTSDVVCNGNIKYADLVPGKKVSEILEWIQQKFHAQIAVHTETNVVDILLLEDILGGHSDLDLTGKLFGRATYAYTAASRVVLTPDTSLDGAAAAAETLPAFLDKFVTFSDVDEEHFPTAAEGVCRRLATGDLYQITEDGKTRLGTSYWQYDRKNADASEEFAPEDLMPPMVFVGGVLMPFIGDRKHRNTSYNDSKKDKDQDIIIADYAGLSSTGTYNYATTQEYDDAGKLRTGAVNRNAEAQFFLFFKRYGDIILNNSISVEGEFDLPIESIFKYDLYSLKQLSGQMLLPTYFKYEVGRRIKCLNAKFLLVKTFEDGQEDQPVPIPAPGLKWKPNNSELQAIDSEEPPFGCDYLREWNAADEWKVEWPKFELGEPQVLGEQSYHITRIIDRYLEDHRVADQKTFIGTVTVDQWYDAVQA